MTNIGINQLSAKFNQYAIPGYMYVALIKMKDKNNFCLHHQANIFANFHVN